MALFAKQDPNIGVLHRAVSMAFEHVKRDTGHIFNWLGYFHQKHQQHDERLDKIEQQMTYMPKSTEEIKQIIDYYYSYDHILAKIEDLSMRMGSIEQQKPEKKGIRERLVRKIAKNSKDYVKSVIYSLIKKYGQISAPQLKEIVVEEQGLCSKSSFYRLLAEMEQESEVESIQKGKEKTYFHKSTIVK